MKPLPLVLVAVAAGGTSGVVANLVAEPPAPAAARTAPVEVTQLADLEQVVGRMADRQEELEQTIVDLRAQLAAAPASSDRVPIGEIEAAVDRALALQARNGGGENGPRSVAAALPDEGAGADLVLDDVMARLLRDDFEGEVDREHFWQQVRDAGLLDEVVAQFEERAEAQPDDPDVQVDLGTVYLQKIFEVGQGPLAGVWATKADKAFDNALAVDDRHWDARFSKAASLSFWPPVFGKQSEAIHHFEILAEQQDEGEVDPRHAQTYLLLGNLYQQNGRPEKALTAWQRGLERFPDNESLIGQIEIAE